MLHSTQKPQNRHRSPSWLSTTVRAVLLFALAWQGPIPWAHAHGTAANSACGVNCWLSQHLCSHHAQDSMFADRMYGWHFHVALPFGSENGPEQQQRPQQNRIPPNHASDGLSAMLADGLRTSLPAAVMVNLDAPTHSAAVVGDEHAGAAHFFDGYATSLALPLRFGVLRS